MKQFATTLQAIDKTDGLVKTFVGQNIIADNFDEANEIVKKFFPYICILGEIVKEIDEKTGMEINNNMN